jgi:hypothetical protein
MKKLFLVVCTLTFISSICQSQQILYEPEFAKIKFAEYQPLNRDRRDRNAETYQNYINEKRNTRGVEIRAKAEKLYDLFQTLKRYCYKQELIKDIDVVLESLSSAKGDIADDDTYNTYYKYLRDTYRYFDDKYSCK